MKTILLFLLLMPPVLNAQDVNFQWAKRIGGTQGAAGTSQGISVATDASGNVYTTGDFSGTVDFDPGPGSYYLTGNGIFILKLNASGAFVWAKAIQTIPLSGANSTSITLDDFGNIYLTGDFVGTVDFDPGPSNFTLSTNFSMCFLVKLDVSGNFIWAKKMGKGDIESTANYAVKTDAGGNIYISGAFRDTADFDPGPGVYNLYGILANYSHDLGTYRMFIAKLDSSGNFLWAKAPQEEQTAWFGISAIGLSVDNSGNVLLTGAFSGTVDFDPGPGVFIFSNCGTNCLNGEDIFIWKLDTDGNFVWAKSIGKFDNWEEGGWGSDVIVDTAGNVYSIGIFKGTLDFDPGPGLYNLSSPIVQGSNYMSKLDSAGNFVWAKLIQGSNASLSYTIFNSLALDVYSNVYITGWLRGTIDFDPGINIYDLTDDGNSDKFILKLNAVGDFAWAKKMTGVDTSYSDGISITTDNSGGIYTTGSFSGTVDFDPDTNVYNLTSVGQQNTFVDKLDTTGNFQWAKRIGGTTSTTGNAVAADIVSNAAGHVYTIGDFSDTVDFDPGIGTYYLTGPGSFISKLDSSGSFIWAKEIKRLNNLSGAVVSSIALDSFGNIYMTGDFYGMVDFDPSTSISSLSANYKMCFVLKLDTAGNFIWAKQMGKTNIHANTKYSVKTDAVSNIYISGSLGDSADFDPGYGTFYIYGGSMDDSHDTGEYGMFICKLDSGGNFMWAKAPQNVPPHTIGFEGIHLYLDNAGNVYCAGSFGGTVDFDPGPNLFIFASFNGVDVFLWKLTTDGNFVWVKKIVEDNISGIGGRIEDFVIDHIGNVYSVGTFTGIADFDPGPGVYDLSSPVQGSNYISKLNSEGEFVWAKQMQHSSLGATSIYSMGLDDYNNVYLTGNFWGTVDFDLGTGVYNLTDLGHPDKYISKLDSTGSFEWAQQMVGADTSYSIGTSITIDYPGNIYTTGYFRGTVDFDPGTNVYNLTSVGQLSMFVDKLGQCPNSAAIVTQPLSQQACSGISVDFSVNAAGAINYQWQLSTNAGITYSNIAGANASSYTLIDVSTSQNNYQYRCIITGGCNVTISSAAVLSVSTTVMSMEPQSTSVCAGNNHTFSVAAAGASTYQWQLSTDGGNTFNAIAGAINSSYNLSSVTTTQNGYQFRCIVMGLCDTIISSNAVLSVADAVAIIADPTDAEVCSGSNASFLVTAINASTVSYRWEVSTNSGNTFSQIVNGGVYSGSTSSVLNITNADESLVNHRYRCIVSNSLCNVSVISKSAVLIVRRAPTVQLTASPFTSLFPWQTTTLTATPVVSGGQMLPLTWYYNNVVTSASNNSRIVSFNQTGAYQVQVSERWPSDLVCSNRSNIVTINANTERKLVVYPNPNHGQFTISYYNPSGINDLEVVTVYDAKGARVYRARFTLTGIYTSIDISRLSLSAGFYSVVISEASGKRLTVGKLIVD